MGVFARSLKLPSLGQSLIIKIYAIRRPFDMKIRRRRLLQGGLVALGSASALGGYLIQHSMAQTACAPTVWNLTAGQTILVGNVTVTNDATNLYITYKLTEPCWEFGTLHVWVGSDPTNVPATRGGTPIPGQFCQQAGAGGACYTPQSSGLTEYTFTIPFTQLGIQDVTKVCLSTLYVFTHAEVKNTCNNSEETAWGGDQPGTGPRWYFFGKYSVCCDAGPPPVLTCTTAFAKGNYVFTTDSKSNPERLPSLGLTRNRWGWAINLLQAGTFTYDIWAGAGLNYTSNGRKVGTLTVMWDASGGLIATYNMLPGCGLREVHLYAGDGKPTTLAPGQYGYLDGFESLQSSYSFNVNVPSPGNAGADGIWLIAHAVVCC
jgi:hypothetical protein